MKPNLQHHATKVSRHITLHSVDPAALIVTILCEALYLGLTHHEAYDTILITHLSTTDITAHLIGHQIASWEGLDIKAVTYHDLELSAHDNRYEITITFDI